MTTREAPSTQLRRLSLALALWIVSGWFAGSIALAETFLTTAEALALAFPGCQVERTTLYLTEEQRTRATQLAGSEIDTRVLHPYSSDCEGSPKGTAYFDVHRVRTLPETLMVVISPDDQVTLIEILRFDEPQDYIPRKPWYQQFDQRSLDSELALKRAIRPVTGATLTAQATTEAVRRLLALHLSVKTTIDSSVPPNEDEP